MVNAVSAGEIGAVPYRLAIAAMGKVAVGL
jgi:hypothetical protein